jgi:hypothetical protein
MTTELFTFIASFDTDVENVWPQSDVYISAPSLDHASNIAARMLQSKTNTMFCSVAVHQWFPPDDIDAESGPIRRWELEETRRAIELDRED